jgi:hypothetical protein
MRDVIYVTEFVGNELRKLTAVACSQGLGLFVVS